MKRKLSTAALLLCSLLSFAQFTGNGSGTQADPYQITSAEELNEVRNFLNTTGVYFKLMNSIDLSTFIAQNSPTEGWEPIGTSDNMFQGVFDGNRKTISGLDINKPSQTNVGLFGYLKSATIKGVGINDCHIIGKTSVGALVGSMEGSSVVTECFATGNVTGTGSTVGGLIGSESGSPSQSFLPTISNSYFNGDVSGGDGTTNASCYANVGGLVGYCFKATITKCYAAGTVNSSYHVGGILGSYSNSGNSHQGEISRCVAANTTLWGCYYTGRIIGDYTNYSYVSGGNKAFSGMEIYFRGSTTPRDNVYDGCNSTNGTDNGTGISAESLRKATTYTSMGWDFTNIWTIDEGGSYPYFIVTETEPISQTLSINTPVILTYGDNSYTLPATTDQGLPITWSINDETIAEISDCKITPIKGGTTIITASQTGDNTYSPFTATYSLVVNKASLTVKAEDSSITIGDEIPEFVLSYLGFVNDDDVSILAKVPIATTIATAKSPVGNYEITVSGGESDKYEFTYESGTLTILGNPSLENNSLFVKDLRAKKGTQIVLPIELENEAEVAGIYFDLKLPNGITVAEEDGELVAALSSERARKFTLYSNTLDNGAYRFALLPNTTNKIEGNEGVLVNVTVDISSELEEGVYDIELDNVNLTISKDNKLSTLTISSNISTLTIINYLLGDVNNDGFVDLTDAICIVYHVLQKTPAIFIEEAADVNLDGSIDLTDAISIVYRVLNGSDTFSKEGKFFFDVEDFISPR